MTARAVGSLLWLSEGPCQSGRGCWVSGRWGKRRGDQFIVHETTRWHGDRADPREDLHPHPVRVWGCRYDQGAHVTYLDPSGSRWDTRNLGPRLSWTGSWVREAHVITLGIVATRHAPREAPAVSPSP